MEGNILKVTLNVPGETTCLPSPFLGGNVNKYPGSLLDVERADSPGFCQLISLKEISVFRSRVFFYFDVNFFFSSPPSFLMIVRGQLISTSRWCRPGEEKADYIQFAEAEDTSDEVSRSLEGRGRGRGVSVFHLPHTITQLKRWRANELRKTMIKQKVSSPVCCCDGQWLL